MKNFGAKWLALFVVTAVGSVAGMSLNGCSDDGGGGTAGTGGGGAGRGGSTGTAGRGGSGGSGGTAGTAAGRGGTGGGTAGTGGGTAGATAGTGGGTAGTGGAAGGLPCPGVGTFETDVMGFGLNTFQGTGATDPVNLAVREAGARATIAWDGTMGDPTPGSLKVEAPFDAYRQMVDVQKNWGTTMLKNWAGQKLHVRVKVTGGNPSSMNPMGVQPYVNTGASYNYCGKYHNLAAGNGWNDYVLDLTMCPAAVDPTMVIAFGVSIQTGDGAIPDGGTNTMVPMMATINVDSFWLEGSCPGTGGTGGGTAGSGGAGGGTAGAGGATAGAGGATAGAGGATAGAGGATAGAGGATAGAGGATAGAGGATAGAGGATAGAGGATAGAGGATGGTGGTTAALTVSNFDTTVDSFGMNTFMNAGEINLANREGGAMATVAWDGTQGMGTPVGSAKVNAPFDGYTQFVDVSRNFGSTLQDWTGKTSMKVRFKVASGGNPDPSFPAGAQAYVQTTTGYVGIFGYNNVAAGTDWQVASVTLPATPPSTAPNWNLAQVQQVGIKIITGSGTGADAAVASGPPTAATIYIDSVWAE